MTVAPFVFTDWQTAYPQFAVTVPNEGVALTAFNLATNYCNNTDCGVIPCDPATYQPRQGLLYLLTAHVAQLLYGSSLTDNAASPIVGRITDASEGSVSVSADMPTNPAAAWYYQTQFGAMYWEATKRFRLGGRWKCGPRTFSGARGGI